MPKMLRPLVGVAGCATVAIGVAMAAFAGSAPDDRIVATPLPAGPTTRIAAKRDGFQAHVVPLLKQYCYECHGDGSAAGDLELDSFASREDMIRGIKTWQKVISYARNHVMPPPEAESHPSQDDRDRLVAVIQQTLYQFDPANPDPGRVTVRRLNRTEYRNTMRDLLGVNFDPTIDFPQDDTGYGYDNIGDVLTLPPMLMEKYLIAAEKILDEAIPTDGVERRVRTIAASDARASFQQTEDRERNGWIKLTSEEEDSLSLQVDAPAPAEYVVRVLAYGRFFEPPPPGLTDNPPLKLSFVLDDAVVRDVEVSADESAPKWFAARVSVGAGRHALRAAMRRERSVHADGTISAGHIGIEQPGSIHVKEILVEGPVASGVRRISGDQLEMSGPGVERSSEAVTLHKTDDQTFATVEIPADGQYIVRMQAYADQAGHEPPKVELRLDEKPLATFAITAPSSYRSSANGPEVAQRARRAVPRVYEVKTKLIAGKRRLSARFLNNLLEPDQSNPNLRDRNVHVQHFDVVEVNGDPAKPPMTATMRRLFARHGSDGGDAGARALLAEFTLHAWRRPPAADELGRLIRLYAFARSNGETFHAGVKHAMKGVLVSSNFLFRGEPEPADVARSVHPIGEYELAARLSYFLWSTAPDDELLALAGRGTLRQNLQAQVTRMLASPKAQSLVDNFAGQWLQFRNLDAAHPDAELFESYNDRLRDAMKKETRLFFESILREDRSLLDILIADYTFVNERLANHYKIPNVKGEEFRRVSLAGTPRRGVLTHGSVLTLTSNPTRTSPVKRGKWVLENLLGAAPPPPPADIPPLESEGEKLTGTVRQQLEKHRADPMCSSCHAPMDPIGFGLENFDAVGAWREKDGSNPIDATSAFQNGAKFTGAKELVELLARTRRNDFLRAATENTLTFALGRGVEPYDQPAIDAIVGELRKTDGRFSTLIMGVVNSVPFQMRRGTESSAASATDQHRDGSAVAEVDHER